jgi:hypothetical protein
MIITREYFKGDLFTPAMRPSITDNEDTNSINFFIKEYSSKCLLECFGYTLFEQVVANISGDSAKEDSLQKWKDLINGEIIILSDGQKKRWKGLAYKIDPTDTSKNYSFIANYIYFFFERNSSIAKSTTGDKVLESEGSMVANQSYKVSIAWNNFVNEVVGCVENKAYLIENEFGHYVDWYSGNTEFSLYEFIRYKNDLDPTTYPNFQPKYFKQINSFGI